MGGPTTAVMAEASPFRMLPIAPPLATLRGLEVEATDVFVCSWPKSGTTWMQAIVAHLLGGADWSHVSEVTPFYDVAASWDGAGPSAGLRARFDRTGRRAWNTHLLWSLAPRGDCKYIYVVRACEDCLVSFYHHMRNQVGAGGGLEGDAAAFARRSVAGLEPYDSWARHVADWSDAFGDPRVLFVRYEDMKRDLPAVVRGVQRHIGGAVVLAMDADGVAEMCTFEAMQRDAARYSPRSVDWKPGFHFIRAGRVGDGGRDLDPETLATIRRARKVALDGIEDPKARAFFAAGDDDEDPPSLKEDETS